MQPCLQIQATLSYSSLDSELETDAYIHPTSFTKMPADIGISLGPNSGNIFYQLFSKVDAREA